MTLNLDVVQHEGLRPSITVVGVGGAGGNAVNNMIKSNLEGANFIVANTDSQALEFALTEQRVQLGESVTQGLGAGASPEVGRAAAEESIEELEKHIRDSNMVFITAGMGGGTGTGAAPVVARLAREMGILTVGVVTKPFHFEGSHRMRLADQGLEELQKFVDTLIVIPNQNLFRIANEKTTFADAFAMADDVLHSGVRGITDLMVMPGLINLDFADIRAVMSEMGKAMMGTGEAGGERRAVEAAEAAISNPLLDDVSMKGARGVLINITGGQDLTLFEVDEAANRIRDEVDPEANIIFGAIFDDKLEGTMRVSVVATGVEIEHARNNRPSAGLNTQRPAQPAAFTPQRKQPAVNVAPSVPPAKVEARAPEKQTPAKEVAEAMEEERQPSLLQETPAVSEKPQFVPPKPVEPANRPAETANAAPLRRVPEPEAPHQMEEEDDERGFAVGGLFQKVGKVFHRGQDEAQEPAPVIKEVSKQPQVSESTNKRKEGEQSQDEYLDIPAFLRRQAN